jgi:hypothetical protein
MAWQRAATAKALAELLREAQPDDGAASVFSSPPETLNAPALIVGHPSDVRYSSQGFAMDEATLPVVCVGPLTGDDVVDELIADVRAVVLANPKLDGTVASCVATGERNWRAIRVGGADFLAADVELTIQN